MTDPELGTYTTIDATEHRLGTPPRPFKETIVAEEALEVCINGTPVAMLWRTPGHDRELAVGFCFSAVILTKPMVERGLEVILSEASETRGTAAADVRTAGEAERLAVPCLFTPDQALWHIQPVGQGVQVSDQKLWDILDLLKDSQALWPLTGGAHVAGLFDTAGTPLATYEDGGRHNALDKIIGHALLRGIDVSSNVLALSSRASFEMALKAARAGFSVVVSISAATSSAVRLCDDLNVTLAGFARNNRMVVYTHPQRIISGA